MVIDPTALKAEIQSDPLGLGYAAPYAAGDDTAVAALLNAVARRGPVPIIDVSAYCTTQGITGSLEATATLQTADPAVRGLCFGALSILRNDLRLNTADMDDPATAPMLDGLLAAGLITATQKTAIVALGDNRRSRAQELWGVAVTDWDVGQARKAGGS